MLVCSSSFWVSGTPRCFTQRPGLGRQPPAAALGKGERESNLAAGDRLPKNFGGGGCGGRHVNFEDPNVNVGLPVFTIHGNHDDPAGTDSLSAVDLLSTARLINYFGKIVRPRARPTPIPPSSSNICPPHPLPAPPSAEAEQEVVGASHGPAVVV